MVFAIWVIIICVSITLGGFATSFIFSRFSQRSHREEADLERRGVTLPATITHHRVELRGRDTYFLFQCRYTYQQVSYEQEQRVTIDTFNRYRDGDACDVLVDPDRPQRCLLLLDRRYWKSTAFRFEARVVFIASCVALLLTLALVIRIWSLTHTLG